MERDVIVTGAAGRLGRQLKRDAPNGVRAIGTDLLPGMGVDIPNIDLADAGAVKRLFSEARPSGVIHAAAWVDVDGAEQDENLPKVRRANVDACRVLAERCNRWDIPLVIVSTDYVYDGTLLRPYVETDPTNPMSVYGLTKLEGEQVARRVHPSTTTARTQWLYGEGLGHFLLAIFNAAKTRKELPVVNDQHGSPTSTPELALALWYLLLEEAPGIYHASCEGACTWYDLAVATLEECNVTGVTVVPISTAKYFKNATRKIAHRPANSVLDCSKLARVRHGKRLAHWRDALRMFLKQYPI